MRHHHKKGGDRSKAETPHADALGKSIFYYADNRRTESGIFMMPGSFAKINCILLINAFFFCEVLPFDINYAMLEDTLNKLAIKNSLLCEQIVKPDQSCHNFCKWGMEYKKLGDDFLFTANHLYMNLINNKDINGDANTTGVDPLDAEKLG